MNITVGMLARSDPDEQLDDTSPQIRYWAQNGAWDPEHSADTFLGRYFDGTFRSSKAPGDTATITFWASGIEVRGAKRMNHDDYAVKMDDADEVVLNGYAPPDGAEWQSPLYAATDLAVGADHTVVLTNRAVTEERMWLDIDYIVLSGPSDMTMTTHELDDTDAAFVYSEGWEQGDIAAGQYRHNSTVHVTRQKDAAVDFTLDESDPIILNGSYINFTSPVSLFAATGLPQATHTVRFVNLGEGSATAFDIDYAVVNSTQLASMVITSNATAPNLADPVQEIQTFAMPQVGNDPVDFRLVIASVLAPIVLLVVLALWLHIRYRRKPTVASQRNYDPRLGVSRSPRTAGVPPNKREHDRSSSSSWTIRTPPTPSDGGPAPVWPSVSPQARQQRDAEGVCRPAPALSRQQRSW